VSPETMPSGFTNDLRAHILFIRTLIRTRTLLTCAQFMIKDSSSGRHLLNLSTWHANMARAMGARAGGRRWVFVFEGAAVGVVGSHLRTSFH